MIPVVQTVDTTETLRRIVQSITYSEDVLAFPIVPIGQAFTTATPTAAGAGTKLWVGVAVDRPTFRRRLKDARWAVYAAGLVNTRDANTAVIGLQYVKDDGMLVPLGVSLVPAGPGFTKWMLGPFD